MPPLEGDWQVDRRVEVQRPGDQLGGIEAHVEFKADWQATGPFSQVGRDESPGKVNVARVVVARGAGQVTGGQVCYQVYETRDGKYMTLAAPEPRFWTAFCQTVGRQDLLAERAAPALPGERAFEELRALFLTRTRQEWVDALAGLDVCCEPVYAVEEALASAPVQALGMLTSHGLRVPLALRWP